MQNRWASKILIAICLLIPLAFSLQTFDQFAIPKQLIFNLGCGILLLLVLLNFKKLQGLPKYLQCAIIFFLCVGFFQTIRLTNPFNGFFDAYGYSESFLTQCGFLILFLSGYLFMDKDSDLRNLNLAMIITIYLTGLFGIYQYYFNDPITKTQITRVKSLLGDPNSFGVFLLLALILAINEFASQESKGRKLLAAGSIYVGITALVLTFSRASWLGFLISFMIYISGMFIYYRNKKKTNKFKPLAICLIIIILIGIISAEILTSFQPKPHSDYEIEARISSMVSGNDSGRGLLWSAALNIFKNSPFLGYGFNSFCDNFHYWQTPKAISFWGPDRDLSQAHNETLHYLATQGLLGLAAYLGLLFAILIAAKPLKFLHSSTDETKIAITLFSATSGYLIFIQFAYPLIHYTFLFWIYLGILIRMQSPLPAANIDFFNRLDLTVKTKEPVRPEFSSKHSRLTPHALCLIVLLLICGWGWAQYNIYTADVYYRKAFYQARYHQFLPSLTNYRKVISLNPRIWYYRYRYAVTLNRAALWEIRKHADNSLADKYLSDAKSILDDLMKKNPRHYQFSYLLGQIAETRNNYTEAADYYRIALDLYPNNYKIIFRLAKIEIILNNKKEANRLFVKGLQLNSTYMKDMALKENINLN